jgi:hypothetical protein
MTKKPLIPFHLLPFTWGMKGKTREIAKAEYELSGLELDLKLLEINKDFMSEKDYKTKRIGILHNYKQLSLKEHDLALASLIENDYEREVKIATINFDGYEAEVEILKIDKKYNIVSDNGYRQELLEIQLKWDQITQDEYYDLRIDLIEDPNLKVLARLEYDLKDGKISQVKYEKEKATLNGEPWIHVVELSFNPEKPEEGMFEMDWNDKFVETLKLNGYTGSSDDEIVNLWFLLVCKNIAMEEFGGTGTFDEDVEANIAAQPAQVEGKKVYK